MQKNRQELTIFLSNRGYCSVWPLFAWILSTVVVTVLISLLFDAEDRCTVQLVGCVVIGAILLIPFRMLARMLLRGKTGK